MIRLGYKKIFISVFAVWIIIWINFFIRDLTKGKHFKEYKVLLSRDAMGKASYTYGDRFFEFLRFCNGALPDGAGYELAGVESMSIDERRAVYYLYPHFKVMNPEYLLVFDKPGYVKDGYVLFRGLDSERFILKRI